MPIQFVKRKMRTSAPRIFISLYSRIIISIGFFRHFNLMPQPKYVRLGYDRINGKIIALQFYDLNSDPALKDELIKLCFVSNNTTAYCYLTPLLIAFKISIKDINGYYGLNAIERKENNTFILNVSKRELLPS